MTRLKPRQASAYLSPQHSPALGYGSPAVAQAAWIPRSQDSPRSSVTCSPALTEASIQEYRTAPFQRHTPPLPPHQHDSYVPASAAEYPSTIHASPLSPPASDGGLRSPPVSGHEFSEGQILPNTWPYNVKPSEPNMEVPLPDQHSNVPGSPPAIFIEDILRNQQDAQPLDPVPQVYLDENGFPLPQPGPHSEQIKRERADSYLPYSPSSAQHHYPMATPQSTLSPPERSRRKRHLTDPGEATHHCEKCGKCFSRVWNYNAHQETHDPDRPRPHTCPYHGCDRAFVRRTDLTRHTQCVHDRDKKFRCSLCNNLFARKDTLRRHEDDGCPKRVDIVSRHTKHKPLSLQSQALSYYDHVRRPEPEPPVYFESYGAENNPPPSAPSLPRPPHYSDSTMSAGGLPPLSDVVPIPRHSQWQC